MTRLIGRCNKYQHASDSLQLTCCSKAKNLEPHFYNLTLDWLESRRGQLRSPELHDRLEVATPPPFPGGMPCIWSPEHLLTASVASCFMTTFLSVAEKSRLLFHSFSCPASGKLDQVQGRYLMTEIFLTPKLVLNAEEDKDKALRILQKAEEVCLISNSIRSAVNVEPELSW